MQQAHHEQVQTHSQDVTHDLPSLLLSKSQPLPSQLSKPSLNERIQIEVPSNTLLESLGLGQTESRWIHAEKLFLEVFYGKHYMPAYNALQSASRPPPKVYFMPISSHRMQSKPALDPVVNAGCRISRPRTAELAPNLRRRLERFRELDTIAFVKPQGLGTPMGTPVPGSFTDHRSSATRLSLSCSRSSMLGLNGARVRGRSASAARTRLTCTLSPDMQQVLANVLGTSFLEKYQTHIGLLPTLNHISLIDSQMMHKTPLRKIQKKAEYRTTHGLGVFQAHIQNELLPTSHGHATNSNGHFLVRRITSKYKTPRQPPHRRMTPRPAQSRLPAIQKNISQLINEADISAEPFLSTLQKTPALDSDMVPIDFDHHSLSSEHDSDDSNNELDDIQMMTQAKKLDVSNQNLYVDSNDSSIAPDPSPVYVHTVLKNSTVPSASSMRRAKRIGNVFPLDFFMDKDCTQKLILAISHAEFPDGVPCVGRLWLDPKGKYFESFECLVRCISRPHMWVPCKVVSYNIITGRFTVKWSIPEMQHQPNTAVNEKLITEIMLPGDTLASLKSRLMYAKQLRDEFETHLAVQQCIKLIRPMIEHTLPEFPKTIVERIFTLAKSQFEASFTFIKRKSITAVFDENEIHMQCKYQQEQFENQLLDIHNELQNDFINSELKSLLIQNRHFKLFVPDVLFLHKQNVHQHHDVVLSSDLVAENLVPVNNGHANCLKTAVEAIELQLQFKISLAAQDALFELHQSIASMFSLSLLDTIKKGVTRVCSTKSKLGSPNHQGVTCVNELVMPAQIQHPTSFPKSHLLSCDYKSPNLHGRKQPRPLHPSKKHDHDSLILPPTHKIWPATSNISGNSATLLNIERVENTTIHPITDHQGNIAFTPVDFLDVCKWLQTHLSHVLQELIPSAASICFKKLIKAFHNITPFECSTQLDFNVSKQADMDFSGEVHRRISRIVTVMTYTFLAPFIDAGINSIYQAAQLNQLHIQLNTTFDLIQSKDAAEKCNSMEFVLDYEVPLDELSTQLKLWLTAWTNPISCISPGESLSIQLPDHTYTKVLLNDLVDDSIEGCLSHLNRLKEKLIPSLTIASELPVLEGNIQEYLSQNIKCLDKLSEVKKVVKFHMDIAIRGLCKINHDNIKNKVFSWIEKVQAMICDGINQTIDSRANQLILKCNSLFELKSPTTFEETKSATEKLREMATATDYIRDQIDWLGHLKQFLDDRNWIQSDIGFAKLIKVRAIQDTFFSFLHTMEQNINDANRRLSASIGLEIEKLLKSWDKVDSAADILFIQPIKKEATISKLSNATSSSEAFGSFTEVLDSKIHGGKKAHFFKDDSKKLVTTTEEQSNKVDAIQNPDRTDQTDFNPHEYVISVNGLATDNMEPDELSKINPMSQDSPIISAQKHQQNQTILPSNLEQLEQSSFKDDQKVELSHPVVSQPIMTISSPETFPGATSSKLTRRRKTVISPSLCRPTSSHTGVTQKPPIPKKYTGIELGEITDVDASLKEVQHQIFASIDAAKLIMAKIACIDNIPGAIDMDIVMDKMYTHSKLIGCLICLRSNLVNWRTFPIASLSISEVNITAAELMHIPEKFNLMNSPIVKANYDDMIQFMQVELPLLTILKNPIFREEHWEHIRTLIQFDLHIETHSIQDIIDTFGFDTISILTDTIEPIEAAANKEYAITNVIKEIKERYQLMPIELETNNCFGLPVVKNFTNYISTMESDLLTLGMMMPSKGMEKYSLILDDIKAKLHTAIEAMREWEKMQPLMISVHGFFESEEVRLQLSVELRRFRVFETGYHVVINNVQTHQLFSILIEAHPDLPISIADIRIGLRKITDDVQGWLDKKRLGFPRLFFVSDDELLELVSIAKDPFSIQHQLPRYFDFTEMIYTTNSSKECVITGVKSSEGESVLFNNSIETRELGVEQWLLKVEQEVQATLQKILVSHMQQLQFEGLHQHWSTIFEKMVHNTPSQIIQLAFQIMRTTELQTCIENNNTSSIFDFINQSKDNINRLAALIRQGDTNPSTIHSWKAMIILEINYRDWGQDLYKDRVYDVTSFKWLKGLRYYFSEETNTVTVRQYLQSAVYGFEYVGSTSRLCWANISERGYAAIWGAMHLKMGVTGYGPVSIGKTEVFKDFARAVGKFAVFFNCSEGVSPQALTRLMTGMAMTGCYLLMTHLDKLEYTTLSIVWQAISSLRDFAERKDAASVSFLGRIIKLPPSSNVPFFSTISPDSLTSPNFIAALRSQCRLVAFAAPDQVAIASGLLHMAAFTDAQNLAEKISALFVMAGDQLSRQTHYDFNLRTIRTVIRLADASCAQGNSNQETKAVVKAITSYIVPKLIFDDFSVFTNLIETVFGACYNTLDTENPKRESKYEMAISKLEPFSIQQLVFKTIDHFIQIIETGQHAIVLGKVGVGKTSLIHGASSVLGSVVDVVNPRALPSTFLFGFQESTGYQKGIIESIADKAYKSLDKNFWLVFDGPLESSWADSVSSMLQIEEGGALCLSNGKRVILGSNMTVVIETDNLDNASAGFVGRFNIVFVRNEWSWRARLQAWLLNFQDHCQKMSSSNVRYIDVKLLIDACFSSFMEKIIQITTECKPKTSTTILLNTCLDIFESLFLEYGKLAAESRSKSAKLFTRTICDLIEDMFHYSVIWSFGACINTEFRKFFDQSYQRLINVSGSNSRLATILSGNTDISLFDLKFEIFGSVWSHMVDDIFGQSIQATKILSRQQEIISLLLRHKHNALLMGEIGSRKTSTATQIMLELCEKETNNIIGHAFPLLPKSSITDFTSYLQKILVEDDQQTISDRRTYTPANNNSLIMFVDDLQILTSNAFGSRTIWELFRFFTDSKGYWSTPSTFRHIHRVTLLAACDLLQNSIVVLPLRLMRQFSVIFFDESDVLEDSALRHFYADIYDSVLDLEIENIQSRLQSVVNSTLDLVRLLKKQLCLSSDSPFYLFSTHDLEKLLTRICMASTTHFSSNQMLFQLWSYEASRVFEDRARYIDQPIFKTCLQLVSKKHFHIDSFKPAEIMSDIDIEQRSNPQSAGHRFSRVAIREMDETTIHEIIEKSCNNSSNTVWTLSDFSVVPDSAVNFVRLDRVFSASCHAHAILVCHPGQDFSLDVVKQVTLARSLPLAEITFQKDINLEHWRSFVRKHATDAGLNEIRTVVCITFMRGVDIPAEVWGDLHVIMDGARSRYIWPPNEFEDLMNKVSHQFQMKKNQVFSVSNLQQNSNQSIFVKNGSNQPNQLEMTKYWAQKIQQNVSFILRIDATDIEKHQYLLQFPRLICRSTVIIFKDYNTAELEIMSYRALNAALIMLDMPNDEIERLGKLLVCIFSAAFNSIKDPVRRHQNFSVLRFSRFISQFALLLTEQKAQIETQLSEYYTSLQQTQQLRDRIQEQVQKGKQELVELPLQLTRINDELSELSIAVKTSESEAARLTNVMNEKRETFRRLAVEREIAIANAGLTEAKNAFENAIQQLHSVKKNDLEELKEYVIPTPFLALVSDGLCILFDRPTGWSEAKKLLSSHTFLPKLIQFDCGCISETTIEKLRKIIDHPSFQADKTTKNGFAVCSLSQWLRAMLKYSKEIRIKLHKGNRESENQKPINTLPVETVDNGEEEKVLEQLCFNCSTMKKREALLQMQKQELSGRFTIIKEGFSSTSIFDSSNPDQITESQWIQQAFQNDGVGVRFTNAEVAQAHAEYEKELQNLQLLKEKMSSDLKDAENSLDDVKIAIESMTPSHISELIDIKDGGVFTDAAKSTMMRLLKLNDQTHPKVVYQKFKNVDLHWLASSSAALFKDVIDGPLFQRVAFYDSKMVCSSAVSPFQACRGAFLIRDIAISLHQYISKKDRICCIIEQCQKQVNIKKAQFDKEWSALYSHLPEYWTFEIIVQKFKEVHHTLSTVNFTDLLQHLKYLKCNPTLRRLLELACKLVQWDGGIAEFENRLIQDPFSFGTTISKVKIGDESTMQVLNSAIQNTPISSFEITAQVDRVYCDIIARLPKSICCRILTMMDSKTLCHISLVSKKWCDLIKHQQIWKWKSHESGWGIAFNYPKTLDWREFYIKLTVLKRKRIPEVQKVFREDINNLVGLKAYKRQAIFMKRVPEYLKLERQDYDANRRSNDIIQLELTNDLFMAIEDQFSLYLSETESQALSFQAPTSAQIQYKQNIQKNSSLRLKKAIITVSTSEHSFGIKHVHELIIEKASKLHCLHNSIERVKKYISRVDSFLRIDCPTLIFQTEDQNIDPQNLTLQSSSPGCFSILYTLSNCLDIIYAYHRGMQMGKHIQFQVRFIRSLNLLCTSIESNIAELKKKKTSVQGDAILFASTCSLFPAMNFSERDQARKLWIESIMKHYLIREFQEVISEFYLTHSRFWSVMEADQIQLANALLLHSSCDMVIMDPDNLAAIILADLEKEFKMMTCIDAFSPNFYHELDSHIMTSGVIAIKNVGAEPTVHSAITKFKLLRCQAAQSISNLTNDKHCKILIFSPLDILDDLEPTFDRIDINFTSETLTVHLIDVMFKVLKPKFHLDRIQLRTDFEDHSKSVKQWFSKIIEVAKKHQSIEEEIVYDIIMFQRKNEETQVLKTKRELFDLDIAPLYLYYNKIVSYVIEVWQLMRQLESVDKKYCFSNSMLIHCFEKSILYLLETSFSGQLQRHDVDTVLENFTSLICNSLGRAIHHFDRVPFFAQLVIVKMRYYEMLSKKDYYSTKLVVQKRAEIKNDSEFTTWVHDKFISQVEDRPQFIQLLSSLLHSDQRHLEIMSGPLCDLYERRLAFLPKFFITLIALPQFVDEGIHDVLQEIQSWTPHDRNPLTYFSKALESPHTLILTLSCSPKDTIRNILLLSETYDESHLQLSIINEADKLDRWIEKISFAAENETWILITLDTFWMVWLPKIHQISKMTSNGFKIWLISPSYLTCKLPLWLFKESRVVDDSDNNDQNAVLQKLEANDSQLGDAYRPWLAIVLKFHSSLVHLSLHSEISFPKFMVFDEIDYAALLKLYALTTRMKLPLDTLKHILMHTVYSLESRSDHNVERLNSLWNQVRALYDSIISCQEQPLDIMTKESFLLFFQKYKTQMYSKKEMYAHNFGNTINIDHLSRKLCSTLAILQQDCVKLDTVDEDPINVKYKLGQYLSILPDSVSVRLIYENMELAQNSHFKYFLLEEANNFLRLIRRVRIDLQALLSSFSNGYSTSSSKKTIQAILENKIPKPWIRRSHPTTATLSTWIHDISKRVKALNKWISIGQPWLIHASLPFSLRALLHTFRKAFADKCQTSVDAVELVFEPVSMCDIDRRSISDLMEKQGVAIVITGLYMDGVKICKDSIVTINAGVANNLPLYLVRPSFPSQNKLLVGSCFSSTTYMSHEDADIVDTLKPVPPFQLDLKSKINTHAASQKKLFKYKAALKIFGERAPVTELLEDGTRHNQICELQVKSTIPPDVLLQQDPEILVDVADKLLPNYLQPGYIDLNYFHSLNSMSDSLDKNMLDTSYFFTVYVCSTSDADNERRYLFETVFPMLMQDLAYRHIDLHFVDMKLDLRDGVDPHSQLHAACTQIRRASLFIGIFGAKLGPVFQKQDISSYIMETYPFLKQELAIPKTITELEIACALQETDSRYSVNAQRACLFYFRDPNFSRSMPKSFRAQYEPNDLEEKAKINQLRSKMLQEFPDRCVPHYSGHFTQVIGREVHMGGLEKYGERLRSDLLMQILECVKNQRRKIGRAPFSSLVPKKNIGRENITSLIINSVCSPSTLFLHEKKSKFSPAVLIYGPSGSGKTATLSYLCREFVKRDVVVLHNFVRTWVSSFNVDSMIRRFCIKLFGYLRVKNRQLPVNSRKLRQYFIVLLHEIVYFGNKVVIVIDEVDRMVDSHNHHDSLSWMPHPSELGIDVRDHIFWIFSAADNQIYDTMQRIYHDAARISLDALTEDDKRNIIIDKSKSFGLRLDARSMKLLLGHPASDSPLYLHLVFKEAHLNMTKTHFQFNNYILETVEHVFERIFERMEKRHGVDLIKKLLGFISIARNGLREVEIIGLLKIGLLDWNLLFESIEEYVIKTSAGFIIFFHDQFTFAVKHRYLNDLHQLEHYHHILSDYFISICDPKGNLTWTGSNAIRAIDISHHQFHAKRPISEISVIMCSIGFISAVFASNLAYELSGQFCKAIKLAVSATNPTIRTKLTDYNFFAEQHSRSLAMYPKLAYSLALNLPNGFCLHVREEALQAYQNKTNLDPFLNCLSLTEDQLEMVPLGNHQTNIIYIGVITISDLGKCCISVSTDGTLNAWNIDTFLHISTLVVEPLGDDTVVQCCFGLNDSKTVVYGTHNGHICVYNTGIGHMHARIENIYTGGILFCSDNPDGVWQRGHDKTLQWVQFSTQRVINVSNYQQDMLESKNASVAATLRPTSKDGRVDKILARSVDGKKIAYLILDKRHCVVVMATKTIREVCRFAEDGVGETSIGQFSIGKDLLAVVLSNGDVMLWKIDTHSRVALVRIPIDTKISCLSISNDENLLYFGSTSSLVGIACTKTGKIVKRLSIGEKKILGCMCIAASKGQERFFSASDSSLFICDSQSNLYTSITKEAFDANREQIPSRHAAPINAVLAFKPHQSHKLEAISTSKDGRLVVWSTCTNLKKFVPVRQNFVADDLTSCRIHQSTGFAIITSKNVAIVWNVEHAQEVLRISHTRALRDAVLMKFQKDQENMRLYTWAVDGELTAWKLVGRPNLFVTYDPKPLFCRFVTHFYTNSLSSSMSELLVACDTTAMTLDSLTGSEIRKFDTRVQETIIDLTWLYNPAGQAQVVYTTKSTLFIDGNILSYGGSLGDSIQIDTCKYDNSGTYLGYSGVQFHEMVAGDSKLEKPVVGIITVIALKSNEKKRRLCTLMHDGARIVHWSFMHDSNYIVTVTTDLMIRVWDIQDPLQSANVGSRDKIQTPMQHDTFGFKDDKISFENINATVTDESSSTPSRPILSSARSGRRISVSQHARYIGTQISGKVGHVRAMFPLRSPCTSLEISSDDYIFYTGSEQGDVFQFRFEFGQNIVSELS
ncbi:hypothetical protein O5D80_007029 [Batrachochytrium dendrobatidis]|nr:hypothetical protein O5D80_007029 [Batrachochytrium dendrobatidis]